MSWYWIVLLVIFYIAMWSITTIILTRLAKDSDPEWIAFGMVWPILLMSVPFMAMTLFVIKIVNKYGYKEETK